MAELLKKHCFYNKKSLLWKSDPSGFPTRGRPTAGRCRKPKGFQPREKGFIVNPEGLRGPGKTSERTRERPERPRALQARPEQPELEKNQI